VSFAAITLCIASQRVLVVVVVIIIIVVVVIIIIIIIIIYFVIVSVRKLLDTSSYCISSRINDNKDRCGMQIRKERISIVFLLHWGNQVVDLNFIAMKTTNLSTEYIPSTLVSIY
jgi:hypothetical protein